MIKMCSIIARLMIAKFNSPRMRKALAMTKRKAELTESRRVYRVMGVESSRQGFTL